MLNHDDGNVYGNYPLMISSSGGSGHISAIQAIIQRYPQEEKLTLPSHEPQFPDPKSEDRMQLCMRNATYQEIMSGVEWTYSRFVGRFIRWCLPLTPLPLMPTIQDIEKEVEALGSKNTKTRQYVDMLLDAQSAGYEGIAIWNFLWKKDQIEDIKKIIKLKNRNEKASHEEIKEYFAKKLTAAAAETPYTSLVSTQAVGLSALCDAVIQYNAEHPEQQPPITIHQYLTDLPTDRCVHFFSALQSLTQAQKNVMRLYGVGLSADMLEKNGISDTESFAGIASIDPHQNPMVRAGFLAPSLSQITLQDECKMAYQVEGSKDDGSAAISKEERVASIMLGSQAGIDTSAYVEALLQTHDHIFVFGGKSKIIAEKLDEICLANPNAAKKIIRLDNQDDVHMANIMTRSNTVVIRGGGLSIMEQMAIHHPAGQSVFIHHKESGTKKLTSGIPWEDGNTDRLIGYLKAHKTVALKTSPERIRVQAEIINLNKSESGASAATTIDTLRTMIVENSTYRVRGFFGGTSVSISDEYGRSVSKRIPRNMAKIYALIQAVDDGMLSNVDAIDQANNILQNRGDSYWRDDTSEEVYASMAEICRLHPRQR